LNFLLSMSIYDIKKIIEEGWSNSNITENVKNASEKTLELLDNGSIVICHKVDEQWLINDWIRKAILIYFKSTNSSILPGNYYDKIPLKFSNWRLEDFKNAAIRVVPGAFVRYGVYVSSGCIIMPSFVNVGSYIGKNTMVDINATLGSCCYVGDNCHIGAGTVIGGVLEPLHDRPTIIEDNVFIGACCSITSGVILSTGCVIAPGTHISQSTRIYDSTTGQISYGVVPENAVVVSGTIPRDQKNNDMHVACGIIVKYADAATRNKVGINELLR
jgi:2,3,4,5-tetrahydropyridine-2-carboxylate N-succinyltransferase